MSASLEIAQHVVNKSIAQFNIAPPPALARYLAEVLDWNPTLGLISRKDPLAACERLLLESIEFGRLLGLEPNLKIADVGSGAGFPGVVWAILHSQLELVLVERREKRAIFLERVCRGVGAGNVSVLTSDVRDVAANEEVRGSFDLVTTIAVGDPALIGHEAGLLLKNGGRFASTVSRETSPPEMIGAGLRLEQRHEGEFGCYLVYRLGV